LKIFLDTGDVEAIRQAYDTGLIDGVTTNPGHIAKTQRKFGDVVKEIFSIVPGLVSVEAVSETADKLIEEAAKLSSIAPNVVIKIPMTPEDLKAVPVLEKQKSIKANVTMIFSSTQAFLAMKAGASLVSIVLSRLDAVANESRILVEDAAISSFKDYKAYRSCNMELADIDGDGEHTFIHEVGDLTTAIGTNKPLLKVEKHCFSYIDITEK